MGCKRCYNSVQTTGAIRLMFFFNSVVLLSLINLPRSHNIRTLMDRGVPTRRAFFGEGRGPVHLSRAECRSGDVNLLDCTIDKSAVNGCDHSEDAGVICNGIYDCMCARLSIILCPSWPL